MANSTLRMDIVTALDNAGIKATEQQIAGLEKQLNKVNQKSKLDNLENSLGKLPGNLGKIQGALGGIAAKAASVFGAFMMGYDIGTKFVNDIQMKLPKGWWNEHLFAIETLKKENRAIKKWQEEEIYTWNKRSMAIQESYGNQRYQIDLTIDKINQQVQSYTRLAKAASEYANANSDKDIQQLERERFEDVLQLQSMGEYDAADQANKVYDVMRKELEGRKQIGAFDDEQAIRDAKHLKDQEKINLLLEKEKQLKAEAWKLEGWKDDLDAGLSNKEIDKNQQQINTRLKQIKRERDALEKEANTLADDLDAYEIESATYAMKRATLVDSLRLESDKAAMAYDRSVAENGNLLGVEFTKDFVEQFNKASIDSYNELKAIEVNTQGLRALDEKIDSLLSVKQGG